MSYPGNWSHDDIHHHETGELLCTHCFKYVHEDNTKEDVYNNTICTDCADDINCFYCGEADRNVERINGHRVCPECMEHAVDDMDLTFGEDQRGDHAYFIHLKHFTGEWEVSKAATLRRSGTHFFRCLNDKGFAHQHGWIEWNKVVQWG